MLFVVLFSCLHEGVLGSYPHVKELDSHGERWGMRNTVIASPVGGHWCSLTLTPCSALGQAATAAAVLLPFRGAQEYQSCAGRRRAKQINKESNLKSLQVCSVL